MSECWKCHMDGKPCHNEPILDNQQGCRYWYNAKVIEDCKKKREEKKDHE